MSQYFNLMFNSINIILFNYFICLSFCDNQTFEVLFYNNTALEIIENVDSNSSVYIQISPRNTTINQTKLKSDDVNKARRCFSNSNCNYNYKEICCPYELDNQESVCIYSDNQHCRGISFRL